MQKHHEAKIKKARLAAKDERVVRPLLATAVVFIAGLGLMELVPPNFALLAILAPALAGLVWPAARGAPRYSELLEMVEEAQSAADPVISALSKRDS